MLDRIWPPATAQKNWLSHIGGWPNLADDEQWPRITFADGSSASLDFLAQIDLSTLPQGHEKSLLPANGTLYFFALAQSSIMLEEHGPESFRVIYRTGSAAAIPPRKPPDDAGWGQQDDGTIRSGAVSYRDTDGPLYDLFPYCPVKPRLVTDPGDAFAPEFIPINNEFNKSFSDLPRRVEDALLNINFVRNSFFENIHPIEHIIECNRGSLEKKGLTDCIPQFKQDYHNWRLHAASTANALKALGRSTLLTPDQRTQVLQICQDASDLHKQITPYRLFMAPDQIAKISMATLLLHDPLLAEQFPDEVKAAHPYLIPHDNRHRMLGNPRGVQGGTLDREVGAGLFQVLLLQLEGDAWGPRFTWWDGGNLTYWMSASDMAELRFDRVNAEIEGH